MDQKNVNAAELAAVLDTDPNTELARLEEEDPTVAYYLNQLLGSITWTGARGAALTAATTVYRIMENRAKNAK